VKATPTITWAAPADITYGTALSAIQLNASASVPGTFAYTPATGTVLDAGSHPLSVTFTPTDATNYAGATATVSITVVKATPTITWPAPADLTYGTALSATQLNARASVPGTFAYTPATGTVLDAGSRPLSVTFTPTDATNYSGATATVSITVLKATPTITWSTPADITYGTALSATQLNASANVPGTFAYTPAAGTVLDAGTHQLSATFTPTDAANYATATKTVSINVTKLTPTITWPAPADITYGTALGPTQLNATSNVAGAFVYSPAAGTVLNVGAAQPLSVTFTPTDAANYTTATKTVAINVLDTAPTITWVTPADITYGIPLSAAQLNATATVPGTFVYTPGAGVVLNAGAAQTLSVTFTPADANYATATKTVTINVLKATPSITWAAPADISYGTALSAVQLNATASVPGTFAYTPAAGTTLDVGAGQPLSVTFAPSDAANYTTASKTVAINVTRATPVITWPTPADIGYGTPLGAAQLNATTSVAGTFVYSPASGTVLNAGAGQTLAVTFTPTDNTKYTTATANVRINVLKGTPTITWPTPAAITYGTPLSATQLNATANVPGTFVYTPPAGTVLDAGANQTLSVTFTPADAANYAIATATVLISVLPASPTITWPSPGDIVFGTSLSDTQLNATASVTDTFDSASTTDTASFTAAQTFATDLALAAATDVTLSTSSASDVAVAAPSVTSRVPGTFSYSPGRGTVLNAGVQQTLSVIFTPADTRKYRTVTATATINVRKATPTVIWPTPAPITAGTPLSAAQLKAIASTEGTFVYSPAVGTVLPPGAGRTLTATFTPADAANFSTTTVTTTIDVLTSAGGVRKSKRAPGSAEKDGPRRTRGIPDCGETPPVAGSGCGG
jgi:hypothetical protein